MTTRKKLRHATARFVRKATGCPFVEAATIARLGVKSGATTAEAAAKAGALAANEANITLAGLGFVWGRAQGCMCEVACEGAVAVRLHGSRGELVFPVPS